MKNGVIKKFLIRAGIIYLIWLVVYYGVIIPDGRLNSFLTEKVIQGTIIGLNILKYETAGDGQIIYIDKEPVVLVADACNGLELFALYAGFILAFPGKAVYKAVFIPIGILLIFIINILREIALSLNYKFFQETFELNHKYTYVFVVYLFVFLIWRYWLRNYSRLAKV